MPATVRLGTCSFADEGLVKTWYPRGVSTGAARLHYYGERFDTVEVDSPYYHLPDPAVTGRWAQRTPPEFVFHVKAHKTMTFHEGEPSDEEFAKFRASIEPLELSGKLRGILLQYHPRFTKSDAAKAELARVPARLTPLVPLVEFRHRSWMEPAERDDTIAFLRETGLSYVSVDADEVYAMFNNNRDDFAPRSAAILRGLLDEAGVPASGGLEPPPVAPTL